MKKIILTVLALTVSTSAFAGQRVVLNQVQAKTIALIQARALNANDDVLSIVRNQIEPQYKIVSLQHVVGMNFYQVVVRRLQPGQTCQQSLIIDDSTGALDDRANATCD